LQCGDEIAPVRYPAKPLENKKKSPEKESYPRSYPFFDGWLSIVLLVAGVFVFFLGVGFGMADGGHLVALKPEWFGIKPSTFAGWVSAGATCLGVVLVAATLYFTHRTLNEAKAATEAANRTVLATREIGRAQVRAYLVVRAVRTSQWMANSLTVTPTISNEGQSPAKNIRVSARLAFRPVNEEVVYENEEIMKDYLSMAPQQPGPEQEFLWMLQTLSTTHRNGNGTLFIQFKINYEDVIVSDDPHEEKWNFEGDYSPEAKKFDNFRTASDSVFD